MASIFNALHIGYSGLNVAQNGISTTGHNISNAETEGYTRQRVVSAAATPLLTGPGNVGNGSQVQDIKRVFDNFVFDRYNSVSEDKAYSDFERKTLETLSTYFPEIDGVGIKADLTEYYNMWQTFADNPDNDAIKLALATQTNTLSEHIAYTQDQVKSLQSQLNEQLSVNVNEVNSLAAQLADLNNSIEIAEAGRTYTANDLRDKRNVIERTLSKLIGAEVNAGQLESNMQIDDSSNTKTGSYSVNVNGFNIVDGSTFHPLHLSNEDNENGFYDLSFERQDGVLIPISDKLSGGVIGSILNLRGSSLDSTSGMPTDGVIQNVISQLDAFAKGLIESTNNVYARTTTTKMESNTLDLNPTNSIVNSSLNVNEGEFDLIVYDVDGNITARRTITVNAATVMTGVAGSNSIQGQIEAQIDDNNDGNANNDIDDFLQFNWATYASGDNALEIDMDPLSKSRGFTFSMQDVLKDSTYESGTNFAGALGLNRYLDGDSAQSMKLNYTLSNNPTLISAGSTPSAGDNVVALSMVQHQYEKFDFYVGGQSYNTTTYAMFDIIATEVGSQTNAAILRNETITTQFNATQLEYDSVSKVSIDEEMTNLIKYQTSYGAAAKVITTIDQMMDTLLGIKQ
ncbi:flagellar hook-associated protein FlgK [Sulfurimonas sp.]|uniref:flagellar hook-associated protein FlgK n=1 Tax=Sulfurimonas sp. TaxID=2022749 RepID=UPI003569A945